MERWIEKFESGKQLLFQNDYSQAVHELREALELCPVEQTIRLSEVLFFMGVALKNLGQKQYAYRCWENAAMLRDTDSDDDFQNLEWKTFFRIQLVKYLSLKKKKQFSSLAESDMIHDLVKSAWMEIKDSPDIMSLDYYDRCDVYRSVFIAFPQITGATEDAFTKMGQIVSFSRNHRNDGKK
jgi:tetratricopeptide (TPR) repeat protein